MIVSAIQFLNQLPLVAQILAYVVALYPIVTLLINLLDLLVTFACFKADAPLAAKITTFWNNKALPVLEVLPHSNLPISGFVTSAISVVTKVVGSVLSIFGSNGSNVVVEPAPEPAVSIAPVALASTPADPQK